MYQLEDGSAEWKHKSMVLCVNFVMTEYATQEMFTLGRQINQEVGNGSIIDLGKLLSLIPSFQVPFGLVRWFCTKESTLNTPKIKHFSGW
jgi:hypothetical protein